MKTIKDETTIIISRVTSKFVRKIDVFEDAKEKRCKGYIKKLKWHLIISIMMLLYYQNWKITVKKQVWIADTN